MGDDAVIIRGKEWSDSRRALYSTVHGAGRVMGRMEAKGKWKRPRHPQGVELRGGGADEAPECIRRSSTLTC